MHSQSSPPRRFQPAGMWKQRCTNPGCAAPWEKRNMGDTRKFRLCFSKADFLYVSGSNPALPLRRSAADRDFGPLFISTLCGHGELPRQGTEPRTLLFGTGFAIVGRRLVREAPFRLHGRDRALVCRLLQCAAADERATYSAE